MGPLALTPSFLHSVLVDETVDYNNGQYIWDVCFSPDGRLLATGVGDGMVQASFRALTMAIVFAVIIISGRMLNIATFCALDLGYRRRADPRQIPGSHPSGLLGRFLVGREIPRLRVCRSYDENLGYDGRVVEDLRNHRQRWC